MASVQSFLLLIHCMVVRTNCVFAADSGHRGEWFVISTDTTIPKLSVMIIKNITEIYF